MTASVRAVVPWMVGVVGLGVFGCATPAPIVRLSPDAQDIFWVAGRAAVLKSEAGIRVAAAFEHQDGQMLAVRVEVQNQTADRLEVGPQDITYSVCRSILTASCRPSSQVIDPERMLTALAVAQARTAADESNSQALFGTLTIITAAGEVLQAGHGGSGLRTAAAVETMQSSAKGYDSLRADLATQQRIWSNQALRRNTLDPGQGTAGLVYFPINGQAGFVWLQVTVAGHVFPFRFAQTITQVTPSPGPSDANNTGL